jgi:hypothetical protein
MPGAEAGGCVVASAVLFEMFLSASLSVSARESDHEGEDQRRSVEIERLILLDLLDQCLVGSWASSPGTTGMLNGDADDRDLVTRVESNPTALRTSGLDARDFVHREG